MVRSQGNKALSLPKKKGNKVFYNSVLICTSYLFIDSGFKLLYTCVSLLAIMSV